MTKRATPERLATANAEAVIECLAALTDACSKMGIRLSAISLKTALHRNALEKEAATLAKRGVPIAESQVRVEPNGRVLIAGVRLEVHW